MLIPFRDYPVRPARIPGESLAGYVHRFYWANGHEPPQALRAALRRLYLGDGHHDAFVQLQSTIGTLNAADHEWWVTTRIDAEHRFGSHTKWRSPHYSPVRHCPICIGERRHHAELWTLPLVRACPFHHCALVSHCATCGQSLAWSALRAGWNCSCGAPLANAGTKPIASWVVRLASIVASSAHLDRPHNEAPPRVAATLNDQRDPLRDLYDFVGWAQRLRNQLSRRLPYQPGPRWPVFRKPSSSATPTDWAQNFVVADASTRKRALHRLLKWDFRHHTGVLVFPETERPFALAMRALSDLPRNPHTERLHREADSLLGALHAGIETLPNVYFHPRSLNFDRERQLVLLAHWWKAVARRISVLEPDAALSGVRWNPLFAPDARLVVQVLNTLFDAASFNDDVERYSALTKRWHVPETLRQALRPDHVLNELAAYLTSLRQSELAFVLDLLAESGRKVACR